MNKRLLLVFLLSLSGSLFAQHAAFQGLYMYDALQVNPAYAGNKGALVLNANYRDQWGGITGSPKTFSFTTHLLTRSKKAGLGFSVVNDQFGIQKNLKVNAIYAYKIHLKHSEFSLGLAGGFEEQTVDRNALNLNEANDVTFMNIAQHSITPDATFGAMFKNRFLIAGLSAPNLVRLKDVHALQSVNGYLGVVLKLNDDLRLKPTTLVKYVVHSPVVYEGNLTLFYRQFISGGAGWRNDQTYTMNLRLQLNRQFGVAYQYERSYGQFNQFLRNTHEFMLNYTFDYQTNVQSPRYL